MKTKDLKSQIKTKQKKIYSGTGFPGKSEGQDGDLTIRYVSGRGLFLCHKRGGKWYTNRFSEYMPTTSEKNEPLIIPKGRKPRLPGEISIGRDNKTYIKKGGGGNKQIVGSNSGVLDISEIQLRRDKDSGSASTEDFLIKNFGTGRAYLNIQVTNADADPYILFSYPHTGETAYWKQWCIGMDNSASDKLKFLYQSNNVQPLTPSSNATFPGVEKASLTTEGHLTLSFENAGTDTNCFLCATASEDGTIKFRTGAELLDDIGGGTSSVGALDDLSDVTYSSGDLTIASLDTIISGALEFDCSSNITLDATSIIISKDGLESYDSGDAHTYATFAHPVGATSPNQLLTLTDLINASNMTGSGPAIAFKKYFYAFGGGTQEDAGQISFLTEGNWTVTASTRDSKFQMQNLLNGTLQTCMEIGSDLTTTLYSKIQLLDTTDNADMFTIDVGASGATTIATVDDGAAIGHLTIAPDGDLILDPSSNKVIINATDGLYFDGGGDTYITESSGDILDFYAGGVLLLKLSEGAADSVQVKNADLVIPSLKKVLFDGTAAGHTYISQSADDILDFYVGTDNMLKLDETNDRITLEASKLVYKIGSGGDEFSVADSAYAGMILGYRCLGHDAGRVAYTLTNAFVTLHANATVRFIAPPSGVVEVFVQAGLLDSLSGRYVYFGLSDNATYNTIGAEHEELVHVADESDQQIIQNTWVISGLIAGDTYNYWFGLKANFAGSGSLSYGGTGSGHFSPFIMKVTALPTAVSDFAEYD